MNKRRNVFCISLAVLCVSAMSLAAQQKHALVIGNGEYTSFGRLRNPVNDAREMSAVLRGLGFNVDTVINGSRVQMEEAVARLKGRLNNSADTYGFFFYAGHGVQHNGANYLIPVNAEIRSVSYLPERALSVQAILDELNSAGNKLNIVVLDACRNLPSFLQRDGSRGLSVMSPPANSIIIYATAAGSTANDGEGNNGLFTTHLVNNLKNHDLEVTEVFRRTGRHVSDASGGEQQPAVYISFYDTVWLGNRPPPPPAPPPSPPQPPIVPDQPIQASAPQIQVVKGQTAGTPERPVPDNFVRIEGGTFTMGSPRNEANRGNNETQHQVSLGAFFMGKYQVTQREYRSVMGTNPSRFKGDNLPVENVSWFDAVEYCNRRSRQEGLTEAYTISGSNDNRVVTWNREAGGYRLPTEAEWEYACRAGTGTSYSTGSSVAAAGWYSGNSGGRIHAAGGKQPNPWGLYDMHGNVWEWCWDWFDSYGSDPQTNPSGPETPGTYRVNRGGSWNDDAHYLRSAKRTGDYPSGRSGTIGFRVVRRPGG